MDVLWRVGGAFRFAGGEQHQQVRYKRFRLKGGDPQAHAQLLNAGKLLLQALDSMSPQGWPTAIPLQRQLAEIVNKVAHRSGPAQQVMAIPFALMDASVDSFSSLAQRRDRLIVPLEVGGLGFLEGCFPFVERVTKNVEPLADIIEERWNHSRIAMGK